MYTANMGVDQWGAEYGNPVWPLAILISFRSLEIGKYGHRDKVVASSHLLKYVFFLVLVLILINHVSYNMGFHIVYNETNIEVISKLMRSWRKLSLPSRSWKQRNNPLCFDASNRVDLKQMQSKLFTHR